jgi:hypothetical protein
LIPDLSDPRLRRLVVTSHPNHELAILGSLLRLRPALLFLTDGGAASRVADTRRVLDRWGLLENARFLGISEPSLYEALLEGDARVFAELVDEIRAEIARRDPEQVLCESMELYNPLHDLTLPLVAAALRAHPGVELLEFPLIAQTVGDQEAYRVQRFPEHRQADAARVSLGPEELAAKRAARSHGYPSLREQLGEVLLALDDRHLAEEVFATARRDAAGRVELPVAGRGCALRYESRGERLRHRGDVARVITLRDHFVPALETLHAGAELLAVAPRRGDAPADRT